MSKTNLKRILSALCLCLASLFAFLPLQHAGADGGCWMTRLDDEREINTLSIPGTHDSGATHSIADLSGKCQSLSIKEQLKMGVRFFDVRLRLKNDELVVVHSFVDQGVTFDEVFSDMQRFLEGNPGEFLFVSIKEDDSPKNSGLDFTEKLEQTLLESALVSSARTLPKTVGEARGRIHIISRYEDSTIGYDSYDGWKDSTSFALGELYVQDKYRVDSAEEKLLEIEKAIEIGARREYALLLNFTSCYYPDGFPPTYAGTPARKINERLSDMLKEGESKGVFLCDFITEELCKSIIRRNFE